MNAKQTSTFDTAPVTGGTVLVTGGTGKVGRSVVDRLQRAGVPVRIGSRTGTTPFDWHDHRTWGSAPSGVESVFVSNHPGRAASGAPVWLADPC